MQDSIWEATTAIKRYSFYRCRCRLASIFAGGITESEIEFINEKEMEDVNMGSSLVV